jgi:hypothetical protein
MNFLLLSVGRAFARLFTKEDLFFLQTTRQLSAHVKYSCLARAAIGPALSCRSS